MLIPSWSFTSTVSKETNNLPRLPAILIWNWAVACYSCGWPDFWRLDTSCGCFEAWRLDTSYDRVQFQRLDTSYGWLQYSADSSSGGWIRVTADSILQLTQVSAAGYELRPTPSHGSFEFRKLDTSYSWQHPTSDSSSSGWIRLKADSILRLTTSCGWFYSEADLSPSAGLDLRLTYTLVYQVSLRTYSAKYIIFMVCVLPPDFSYHWSRLWRLLQEPWRSLRKLEEAWRSFKTPAATDSSSSGWFKTRDQTTTSRILTLIPPDRNVPNNFHSKFSSYSCERHVICKKYLLQLLCS